MGPAHVAAKCICVVHAYVQPLRMPRRPQAQLQGNPPAPTATRMLAMVNLQLCVRTHAVDIGCYDIHAKCNDTCMFKPVDHHLDVAFDLPAIFAVTRVAVLRTAHSNSSRSIAEEWRPSTPTEL